MKNKKRLSANVEREILKRIWEYGFAALRIAGSGSTSFPATDIIARLGEDIYIIEVKRTVGEKVYIKEDQIEQLEILKEKYPFVKNFKVVELEESVKLLLPQKVTFRLGSYHLSSEALSLLSGICDALKDPSIEKIVVKGHTDNLQGVDNWVLSAKRAEVVLNFLIKECRLQKTKLELMACADTEPIASNETPLGRSKNRRVEIEIRFKGDTE